MTEFDILFELYTFHLEEISKKVVDTLKGFTASDVLLLADDSGLENTWEEICVQVQHEESYEWDVYEFTIKEVIKCELEITNDSIRNLICYMGSYSDTVVRGIEWGLTFEDEVMIVFASVSKMAGSYTNKKIEDYIDPPIEEEEDEEDFDDEDAENNLDNDQV